MKTKPCFALGCDQLIPTHLLMCPFHWRMVPRDLQAVVYSTLRAWKAGGALRSYVIATFRARLAVAQKEEFPPFAIALLRDEIANAEEGKRG